MNLRLLTFLCFSLLVYATQAQQGCPSVNINVLGQDTTLNCCGTLTASYVPNAQTTAYSVSTIPYLPFAFTGGTNVIVNTDDIWSGVITLPFTFCFYGNTYTQCVIGANGLISFNLAYANQYCQWPINAAIPSNQNPINSIMGPFHDIDPGVGGSINYQLYGTYPCRILVVNWNNIPMYQCNNLIDKQQMVIYETTNVIETYIANKPTCNSWNGGDAIHGIQNAAGTLATVVPGRNYPTNWTASNDARRFTPSGGASNVTLNWYQAGNPAIIATGASVQICPSASGNYVVQAIYDPCVGININKYDTVMINVSSNTSITNTAQTNIPCNGGNTGAASFTYQTASQSPLAIWWTPPVSNGTSATNLTAGTYTVYLSDTASFAQPCTTSHVFTIIEPPVLNALISNVTNVNCFGAGNGAIDITVSGGTQPYIFVWNNNQATEDASNLSGGTYNVSITDANNCTTSLTNIIITEPSALVISAISATVATCGNNNATANVVATGGQGGYNYTWNGNPIPNNDSLFNLGGGNYNITISDGNGCIVNGIIGVIAPIPPTISSVTSVSPLCFGGTGAASIMVNNGAAPILYIWSNGDTTNTASNIPAGSYFVTISDFFNCTDTQTIVLSQPTALNAVVSSVTDANCFDESNGGIDITVSGGILPYSFSWNNAQTAEDASNIPAGSYDVTLTDSNSCTFGLNGILIAQPTALVISSLNATLATCGNNNGTVAVIAAGGSPIYAYTWNNDTTLTSSNLSNLTGGVYNIYISDSHGCNTDSSIIVNTPIPPTISSVSIVNPLCFGGVGFATVNVANGTAPLSYSWSPNVSITNTANNMGAGAYFVAVTDFYSCMDSQSFALVQSTNLVAVLDSVKDVTCFGAGNGNINITTSGGVAPYTFTWTLIGNPTFIQSTEDATNLSGGFYDVNINDSHGCSTSLQNIIVSEPSALVITSLASTPATCGNNNGATAVTVSGGLGGYAYTWNNNPLLNTANLSSLAGGTYSISISDANACITDSSIVVAAPIPVAIASNTFANPLCFGGTGSATINIDTATGVPPFNYVWNPNISVTNIANNLVAGNYFVTVTDFYNCTDTQSFVLTQPQLLAVNVTHTDNLCFADAKAMAVATAQGGTMPYIYSWSNGFVGNDTAVNLIAGNYTSYITDSHNCTTSQIFSITQPSQLTSSATGDTICIGFADGTAAIVIGGGVQPYNYLWSNGVSTTATAANLPAGVYIIEVTDVNGCKITQNTQVIASTLPVIMPTNIQDIRCFGESNGAISVNIQNGVSPFIYNWNPFMAANNTATNLAVGSYQLMVTDHFNCKDTMAFTLTEPPLLQGTITSENASCYGLRNGRADIVMQGGTQPYTYTWNTNPPRYTHNVTTFAAGTYTINVNDSHLCNYNNTVIITQPNELFVELVEKIPSYCTLPNGSIIMAATGGTQPFTYSWAGDLSPDTALLNIVGNESYTFLVTDSNGCKKTKTIPLADNPPAEADFITYPTNDVPLFVKTNIHFINQSHNAKSYLWLFGDGDFEIETSPTHKYLFPDTLTAMLIAYNGTEICPDTAKMEFIIMPEGVLWFPNVFTPNGDTHNDVYSVNGLNVITFNMTIYDRWGKIIKELTSMSDFWDGSKDGQSCPEGVYTFTAWGLTIDNVAYKRAGMITLIR